MLYEEILIDIAQRFKCDFIGVISYGSGAATVGSAALSTPILGPVGIAALRCPNCIYENKNNTGRVSDFTR